MSRKHYDALIAGLNEFPKEREAIIRWQAETGTSPDDEEVWSLAGPPFLALRLIASQITDLRRTLNGVVTSLTSAAQAVRDEKAMPRPNSLVLSNENATMLAAEIVRALNVSESGLVDRAFRGVAESVLRSSSATLAKTRHGLNIAFLILIGSAFGFACGIAARVLPWHVIISHLHLAEGR